MIMGYEASPELVMSGLEVYKHTMKVFVDVHVRKPRTTPGFWVALIARRISSYLPTPRDWDCPRFLKEHVLNSAPSG